MRCRGGGAVTLSLCRWCQSGSIFLDGVDISTIDASSLRAAIGIVSQEPSLFAVSIKENISYGVSGIRGAQAPTQNDIALAAMKANAHRFIVEFPEGYDTMVGRAVVLPLYMCWCCYWRCHDSP